MGVNGDNYSNSEGFENHNKIMFKFKRCDILNDLKKVSCPYYYHQVGEIKPGTLSGPLAALCAGEGISAIKTKEVD